MAGPFTVTTDVAGPFQVDSQSYDLAALATVAESEEEERNWIADLDGDSRVWAPFLAVGLAAAIGAWLARRRWPYATVLLYACWLVAVLAPVIFSLAIMWGQTDSELIFLWLLTRMRRLTGADDCAQPAFASMMNLLADAVRELDERSEPLRGRRVTRLNFVLTNGRELYATRLRNSLYVMRQEGSWRCDICGRNHTRGIEYADYRAISVASEPISQRPWRPVPDASLIGVDAGLEVHSRPIA